MVSISDCEKSNELPNTVACTLLYGNKYSFNKKETEGPDEASITNANIEKNKIYSMKSNKGRRGAFSDQNKRKSRDQPEIPQNDVYEADDVEPEEDRLAGKRYDVSF